MQYFPTLLLGHRSATPKKGVDESSGTRTLAALTGVRGVAAWWVVIYHFRELIPSKHDVHSPSTRWCCYLRMPVRGLPLLFLNPERKIPRTMGEWYQLCFYNNLDNDLRAGRAMTHGLVGGQTISVAEARRVIERARIQGWLSPYSTTGTPANVRLP